MVLVVKEVSTITNYTPTEGEPEVGDNIVETSLTTKTTLTNNRGLSDSWLINTPD